MCTTCIVDYSGLPIHYNAEKKGFQRLEKSLKKRRILIMKIEYQRKP